MRKKGKLLEHEYEEMKRHPQLGAAILEKYPLPEAATKMALSHHERWDGNGYPYGLKGKEIPLEARMLALADSAGGHDRNSPVPFFVKLGGSIRRNCERKRNTI